MRFLILTQYFAPEVGAPQVRLAAFVRQLKAQGHEVEVVTALPNHPVGRIFEGYRGRLMRTEEWEGIRVHRVWVYAALGAGLARMANYASFALTCFLGLLRCERPDVLFVESPPPTAMPPAWLMSLIWRCPIAFNVADLWPDSVKKLGLMGDGPVMRFAEWLEGWCYRRATFVNAVTEGIHQDLQAEKGVPAAKIIPLMNGVDTDLFRPLPPDLDLQAELGLQGRQVLVYAGTMGYAHAVETALQAAKRLEGTPAHFLFVGGGSERPKLEALKLELGLTNVTFLDPVPPEQVTRLLSFALAGLCTLRHTPLAEGTRLVKMFPAMACAKPILVSGLGEGARLVAEAGAGPVTPPEDPAALAEAVRGLMADPAAAAAMGARGRAFVERELSWSVFTRRWLEGVGGVR